MMDQPSVPPEKPLRRKGRVMSIILIILLDCLLVLGLIFFFQLYVGSPNQFETSTNWAGYAVASDVHNPQPTVTRVEASWTVPTVVSTSRNTYSATWIGIGGQFGKNNLIQVGTEQDSIDGMETLMAWYELLPDFQVPIPSITVSAGDHITASISLRNSASNIWQIQIVDSAGAPDEQSFTKEVVYNSSKLSAEWIVERPNLNNILRPLADFQQETFTGCTATLAGITGTITEFPHIQSVMYSQNRQITSVSSIASNGTSFTVNYEG
jgi:hypothetical protein